MTKPTSAEPTPVILVNERAEESLIVQALAQGHDVQRRPDANPIAVLQVLDPNDATQEAAA